jgi:hypothetical protein
VLAFILARVYTSLNDRSHLESKFLSTYNHETKKYFIDKLLNTSIEKMELLYHTNQKLFNKWSEQILFYSQPLFESGNFLFCWNLILGS